MLLHLEVRIFVQKWHPWIRRDTFAHEMMRNRGCTPSASSCPSAHLSGRKGWFQLSRRGLLRHGACITQRSRRNATRLSEDIGGIRILAKHTDQNLAVVRPKDGHNDLSQICRPASDAVRNSATVDVVDGVAHLVLSKSLVAPMTRESSINLYHS